MIKIEHNLRNQFFVPHEDGNAMLDYALKDDVMNMKRVFVPPAFRGQGLAEQITRAAFEYAKTKGYSVIPTCPYISQTFLARHPEYQELVRGEK